MATFYVTNFGCRATQADGAAIEHQLLERGLERAGEPATAGLVIFNTCTVTAAADSQARDAIRKLHAANPAAKIIATGCYAQRAPEELAGLPGVFHVVGNSHKPKIPDLVTKISAPNFVPLQALSYDEAGGKNGTATRSYGPGKLGRSDAAPLHERDEGA